MPDGQEVDLPSQDGDVDLAPEGGDDAPPDSPDSEEKLNHERLLRFVMD